MSSVITLTLPPAGGHEHRVQLRLPTESGGQPPLLCLLDGQWTLPLLEQSGHPALERCAVLALGYDGDPEHIRRCRALDYTPPAPDGQPWHDPRVPHWQAGGAAAMLEQLGLALTLCRQAEPRLVQSPTSLYGHSYAGLFVLYALSQGTLPLDRYLCASPSLWWHDPLIWSLLDGIASPAPIDILAGDGEFWYPVSAQAAGPEGRRNGIPTLPAMQHLHRTLHDRGLDARLHILPQASHGQMLTQATLRALELVTA